MSASARRLLAALGEARLGLRTRRRRVLLNGIGVALAAAMLSAAIVIADGLGDGFNRAVKAADMGQLIIRFDPEPVSQVARRLAGLPDLSGYTLRTEVTNAVVSYGDQHLNDAVGEVIGPGSRQGYAIVAGHNLRGSAPEVLVEPAFAAAWHIHLGSELFVQGLGYERVVGFAEGPDDVGYPLAAARFYVSLAAVQAGRPVRTVRTVRGVRAVRGPRRDTRSRPLVNFAELWLRNPSYINEVLVEARDESFGLRNVQFATQSGVRVLIGQAAGIVIDLLVALSAIALVTAAVMLAASARAEVQRRMRPIGIRRAVGATRGHVALTQGLEAAIVAVPAATIGTMAGWLSTYSSGNRLLSLLNEPGPGAALILPLAAGWLACIAIPLLGAAWPAWTAAGRAVITLLRGADVSSGKGARGLPPRKRRGGGLTGLGARLVAARRTRLVATTAMLACSTAFVLLMLALATTLSSLETDPQELGKRYQLTASLPASRAAQIARIPGVQAAEPRYEIHAADAYSLGEVVDVIAYPHDLNAFENPPLASGARPRGGDEAEVGVGLADALGLTAGSTLLLELPSGGQLRLRVSGTVNSLDDQGLVAYVPAAALLAADPSAPSQVAVLLQPTAKQSQVVAALRQLGANPQRASGATARGGPLISVLKTILRTVAIVDGLVCIYALVQACTLTVQERRRTVAVLRACGAGPGAVRRLLLGAVLALVVPAALIGVLLEWLVFGPALSRLAITYASLALSPTATELLITLAGLGAAGGATVLWVAHAASRESVVTGLAA